MARKVHAKQTAFDIDTAQRDASVHEHAIDFAAMALGTLVARDERVLLCPKCAQPALHQCSALAHYFVHRARIVSTTKREKYERTHHCELTDHEFNCLIASGRIKRNREGQILEVRPC